MMQKMHALQLAAQLCLLTESIEDQRIIVRHLAGLVEDYLAWPQEAPAKPVLRVVVPIREEGADMKPTLAVLVVAAIAALLLAAVAAVAEPLDPRYVEPEGHTTCRAGNERSAAICPATSLSRSAAGSAVATARTCRVDVAGHSNDRGSAQPSSPARPSPGAGFRRQRPRRRRAAERGQQFPPSDGDCHTPLPSEVRKWNDTTPRTCGLHIQGGQDTGCFTRTRIGLFLPATQEPLTITPPFKSNSSKARTSLGARRQAVAA